ncbi:hypothetical protein G6F31_019678 [Rhizopus arrhizus]|nr:hypothetical protein G6F31_019678 [Rhizopus arrhizus]
MDQHPGIVGHAAVCQRAGDGIGPCRAATGPPHRPGQAGQGRVHPPVARRHGHAHLGHPVIGQQRAHRVAQHGLSGQWTILFGHGLRARLAGAGADTRGGNDRND